MNALPYCNATPSDEHRRNRVVTHKRRATGLVSALVLVTVFAACSKPAPLVSAPANGTAELLIRNVTVLDVATGGKAGGRDVLVRAGRIAAIEPTGETGATATATVLDGEGRTLVPGLIDAHGHVASSPAPRWENALPDAEHNLGSYLYSGVTTVLDPGDFSGPEAYARRDAVAAGELLGPTIRTAGPIVTAHDGHPVYMMKRLLPWWLSWYVIGRGAVQVGTAEEARSGVARVHEEGADFLKVAVDSIPSEAPRIDKETLGAVVAEAKRRGMRTVAHVGTAADALDAAEAGVDAWVHSVYKERLTDEQVARLASFGIPVVATMAVFENYALQPKQDRVATALEREIVAPALLDSFNSPPEGATPPPAFVAYLEMLYERRAGWRDNVRRLHEAGVTILAGSDTQQGMFPGPGLHRELALLVEAGLSETEAIRAATLAPARFLSGSDTPDFGHVSVGAQADLVLVDGDPTEDVAQLARIAAVINDGVLLERHPLEGR